MSPTACKWCERGFEFATIVMYFDGGYTLFNESIFPDFLSHGAAVAPLKLLFYPSFRFHTLRHLDPWSGSISPLLPPLWDFSNVGRGHDIHSYVHHGCFRRPLFMRQTTRIASSDIRLFVRLRVSSIVMGSTAMGSASFLPTLSTVPLLYGYRHDVAYATNCLAPAPQTPPLAAPQGCPRCLHRLPPP